MFYTMTFIFTKMSSITSISINRNEFYVGNLERTLMQLLSHLIQQLKNPISHFHLNIRIITSIQFSTIIWIIYLAALPCGAQTKKNLDLLEQFIWGNLHFSLVLLCNNNDGLFYFIFHQRSIYQILQTSFISRKKNNKRITAFFNNSLY